MNYLFLSGNIIVPLALIYTRNMPSGTNVKIKNE